MNLLFIQYGIFIIIDLVQLPVIATISLTFIYPTSQKNYHHNILNAYIIYILQYSFPSFHINFKYTVIIFFQYKGKYCIN